MGSAPPIEVGELVVDTETVPRADVSELHVTLELGIGEIDIAGGAESALDTEFRYNVQEWKPDVKLSKRGGTSLVEVRQPDVEGGSIGDDVEYTWTVKLPNDIPCRVDLDVGVGESVIDLNGVDITELTIDAGVGSVDLSLHGVRSRTLSVMIDGGVGEVVVHVPDDIGVRVKGETGLGEFRASGLRQDGAYLVNDAYQGDGTGIDIIINAGIGEIIVDTEEQGTARA
jgi:hypothetical protein